MNNVYYVGSGELTFDLIERIINENLKLELAPEAKLRIQKCASYLDRRLRSRKNPCMAVTTGFGSLCSRAFRGRAGHLAGKSHQESCLQCGRGDTPGHHQTDDVAQGACSLFGA